MNTSLFCQQQVHPLRLLSKSSLKSSPQTDPAVHVIQGVVIGAAEGCVSSDQRLVHADGVEVEAHIEALVDQILHHLHCNKFNVAVRC